MGGQRGLTSQGAVSAPGLRAGQTVGKTQECYMFSECDGDSLVGRTVNQLKCTRIRRKKIIVWIGNMIQSMLNTGSTMDLFN